MTSFKMLVLVAAQCRVAFEQSDRKEFPEYMLL